MKSKKTKIENPKKYKKNPIVNNYSFHAENLGISVQNARTFSLEQLQNMWERKILRMAKFKILPHFLMKPKLNYDGLTLYSSVQNILQVKHYHSE